MRWSRIIGLTVLALLLVPGFGIVFAADVIDVRTDEAGYEPGETMEVEGTTNVTDTVTIIISDSSGYEIYTMTDEPNEDGEFSVNFQLDENASEGTYLVNATVGDIYDTESFEVVVESGGEEMGEGLYALSEEENPCEEFTSVDDLLSAIERALNFIERVSASTDALQGDYDMTLFWERVDKLKESLAELKENVNDDNLAASVEEFCYLNRDVSQLNGLLNSITKNVKEKKALQFAERMMRMIGDLEENVLVLSGLVEVEEFNSAIHAHQKKLERLWLTLNTTIAPGELEGILVGLENVAEGVESDLDDLGDEGYTLKEMYKVQARIEVLTATVEKMQSRNKVNSRLEEKLGNANEIMNEMKEQFGEQNQGKMKTLIEEAKEGLRGVGKTIREVNKSDKSSKGGNGKSNGKGNGGK